MAMHDIYRRQALQHQARLHQLERGHILRAAPRWVARAYLGLLVVLVAGGAYGALARVAIDESVGATIEVDDHDRTVVVATVSKRAADALRRGAPLRFGCGSHPARALERVDIEAFEGHPEPRFRVRAPAPGDPCGGRGTARVQVGEMSMFTALARTFEGLSDEAR